MKILGCDLNAKKKTIAMVDTETGEFSEKTLSHEGNEVREFYAGLEGPVVVGIEATGAMQWFLELLEELGIVCRVGHPAKIRAAETRKQKHDRRDARLMLDLLTRKDGFPDHPAGPKRAAGPTNVAAGPSSVGSIRRDVKKKSSASTGGEKILCLDVQPTAVSVPPDSIERFCSGLFAIPCGFICRWRQRQSRVWKLGKRVLVASVATMVLSEARGLSLFLVKRGGIA